jgi:hypothetical protein
MHHIVHKQSVHDEVMSLVLHENSLLTIYRLGITHTLHRVEQV